jgi:hypothetical protein
MTDCDEKNESPIQIIIVSIVYREKLNVCNVNRLKLVIDVRFRPFHIID